MLAKALQAQAANYVSGALTAAEREAFEVVLEFHQELQVLVAGLSAVVADLASTEIKPAAVPPPALRDRVLGAVDNLPAKLESEALVATDADGRIEWVNPAFTAMCGYTMTELKVRKPGELLQGTATDAAAVARIRAAVRARQPCRETLINYHKSGTPYVADIRIAPVLNDAGEPLWFVARERKVSAS